MIPLDQFLACVLENAARIHAYELGHDGSSGKSDCIGLIIGALKLAGVKWPGIHGSNWAARNAMQTPPGLCPTSQAPLNPSVPFGDTSPDRGGLFLGEIVYKTKVPGQNGYSLPDRYKNSGDLLDYYHVGVVTSVQPLEITHCTGVNGGIKRDTALGAWCWGGKLKYVDYETGGESPMDKYDAIVTSPNGGKVNLRKLPDKKSVIIARVPTDTQVRAETYDAEWARVEALGKTGYMMKEYLFPDAEDAEPDLPEDGDTVAVSREKLETWATLFEEAAREIRDYLGQG